MRLPGAHGTPRTVVVLGAGATHGDTDVFTRSKIARPPLDASFLQYLTLFGHRCSPGYYEQVLQLAEEEFGGWRSIGLEQLLTRIEARRLLHLFGRRVVVMGASKKPRTLEERASASTIQALSTVKLAIRDVFAEISNDSMVPGSSHQAKHSKHCTLAGLLGPEDTVISFNYDTVIDNAIRWRRNDLWSHDPTVYGGIVDPNSSMGAWAPYKHVKEGTGFRLLKLHGSINFRQTTGGENPQIVMADRSADNDAPFIVPPTYTKRIHENKSLVQIWSTAAKRMSQAEAVVVIGYSAPASDYLVQALLSTPSETPLETIVCVNPSALDSDRVLRLFSHRMGQRTVLLSSENWDDALQL